MFATTFRLLRHDETTQLAIVGDAVNVPITVAPHIEAVFGVHGLPLPPRQSTPASPATTSVTPVVIGSVYNVSGVTPSAGTNNVQAVAEFQGQLLSQSDLTTFFTKYVPHAPAGSDKVYKYVGDSQQGEGVEANLDIQVSTVEQTRRAEGGGAVLAVADCLARAPRLTWYVCVGSTSWAWRLASRPRRGSSLARTSAPT